MARESPADKAARIHRITEAWEAFAATRSFDGITLARFKAAVEPSHAARAEIEALQTQMRHAITRRNAADRKSLRLAKHIVNAVMGDKKHGDNSELYAAMGFVPRSARRKPVRRRK